MGKEALAPSLPPILDPATIAMVIRLAEAAEAERHEQRPATYPRSDLVGGDRPSRRTSARDQLLAYLQGLPEETVAALYRFYRAGDLPRPDPAGAEERYRAAFSLAVRPIHRMHGAHDLAAEGPLASGLRRGLEYHGLRPERHPSQSTDQLHPVP